MKLRGRLAIRIGKFADRMIRKWNMGNGGVLPGYLAGLIAPDILSGLSVQVRKKIIVVLGTNGKTTVSSLLCHVLEAEGNKVVINRNGANMINGIVSAFVLTADNKGCLDGDYACIEADEFAAEEVLSRLRPHCIVVTNLFRDQLDRFGEVDQVLARIRKALSWVPEALLVLNCDDPVSYSLAYQCGNPVVSYGISRAFSGESDSAGIRESAFCPVCGKPLEYDFFHYGQLGVWRCPFCKTARPEPEYIAWDIGFQKGGYSFWLREAAEEKSLNGGAGRDKGQPGLRGKAVKVDSGIRFSYNIYNTLAAYGTLRAINAAGGFEDGVKDFDYGNRRESIFGINGGRVQLHLAKNPLGFQQKLRLLRQDPLPKDVILQINDADVDGRDVSWLWDVDFGCLGDEGTEEIIVDGTRRYDMGLRLKYDGIRWDFTKNIRKTVEKLTEEGTGNLYVIVNYSGLYRMNHMLEELQKNLTKHGRRDHFETDYRTYVS